MRFPWKSALALLSGFALCSGLVVACGGQPELAIDKGFDPAADAGADVEAPTLGPALVVDDMHVATFMEATHAFALLGMLINPQFQMGIENGTMLMGLEFRGLDDPAGQSDPELAIGLYMLSDADSDPTNNFNPDAPATFTTNSGPMGMNGGGPLIAFDTASITDGKLHAQGIGSLMMPGLPIPFGDPTLEGQLVPTPDSKHIRVLEQGRMTSAFPASTLQNLPNIGAIIGMGMCQGDNMLDALATGCGFIAFQPDVDLDGDGLEKFYDTESADPDAGTPTDGRIDKCVDGDGTEILGLDCPSDSRIADGYKMIFVLHGVRAIILAP